MDPSPLKAERERLGWSQYELANILGVGVSTVARWEQGKALPYPNHRKKLAALFGKTPQQLGLLPDTDEQGQALPTTLSSELATEADTLTDPVISAGSTKSLLTGDGLEQLITCHLSPRRLWDGIPGSIKRGPTLRLLNPFSWHPLLKLLTILLTITVIMADLPMFSHLSWPGLGQKHASPSPKSISEQDMYYYASNEFTMQSDGSWHAIGDHIGKAFTAVYPQLVNRFARDPASTARNRLRLILLSDVPSQANVSGTTIRLDAGWMQAHPSQIGILTHALASVVQAYPRGVPTWFADGMADYARSVYGPADDAWSLPDGVHPHQSYRQGGAIAARFLVWLQLHTRLDLLDQLHHALQRGQPFSVVFHNLTHETVDHLWSLYQAHPDITPTPQQRYTMAISTKPLFQSAWQLKGSAVYDYARRLFLSNFAMQADITILGEDNGGGFFFRNDETSWYALFLYTNGVYHLNGVYQSHYHPGPLTFHPAIKRGRNQTNRLTAIIQKQNIYIYINGQFVTQVDDPHLLSYGTLGVANSQFTGAITDVRFDHVQVF